MQIYLILGGVILISLALAGFAIYEWSASKEREKIAQKEASDGKEANKIEESNSTLTEQQRRDKLLYRD